MLHRVRSPHCDLHSMLCNGIAPRFERIVEMCTACASTMGACPSKCLYRNVGACHEKASRAAKPASAAPLFQTAFNVAGW